MKYAGIFLLALISFCTSAQFHDKWHIQLSPGSEPLQVNWADVDNDSILDVVVANKINGKVSFIAYSDSAFLAVHELAKTAFVSGTFSLTDFNRDNRIDIIMSGVDTLGNHSTEVFLCTGSFVFQKQAASLAAFSSPKVVYSDLNSDGQNELVMTGSAGHLSAWRWNGNSATQIFDSTNVVPKDILVYDFDGNGFNDIAVSGTDAAAQPKMLIIEFANAFDTIRTIRFNAPVSGKMDAGDVNHDGRMDLLVSGLDSNGTVVTQTFVNQTSTFVVGQTWNNVNAESFRIADIDADGNADISVQGYQNASPVNFVQTFTGDSLALPTEHVMTQTFGDYDRDGDLDLLQLQDTLGLVLLENQTFNINPKPREPSLQAMLYIFNRFFLYWTLRDSVYLPGPTYDLRVETATEDVVYAGEFDKDIWQRMTVTHGNMSTNNFALLQIPDCYSIKLQTVDNAFVGSKPAGITGGVPGGPVSGGPPQCAPEVLTITSCSTDPILLRPKEPEPAAWFSFSKGFLGIYDSMAVESKPDTVFSMTLNGGVDCERFLIYLIEESNSGIVTVTNDTTVCAGAGVDLTVAEQWKDVVWRNQTGDSIASTQTLHYVVSEEEVLTASARNDCGCTLNQTENLRISKPELTTNPDSVRIMKGKTVGLSASGANVYVWTPNESLDNGFIPNPAATPAVTTTYTVTGYDALGCTATATVFVEVEQTAFVPNLFTPNGDGENDQLMIYGLSTANNFRFAIHNRDGNLVYEASDVGAVTSRGWDGSTRNVEQPPGLYYWKVEGNFSDGSDLNLNGRTTGAILLVR